MKFLIINAPNVVPYILVMGKELVEKVGSPDERYLVMSFMRLSRELVSGLSMIIIGALMDIGKLFVMQMINTMCIVCCSMSQSTFLPMPLGKSSSIAKFKLKFLLLRLSDKI